MEIQEIQKSLEEIVKLVAAVKANIAADTAESWYAVGACNSQLESSARKLTIQCDIYTREKYNSIPVKRGK